MLTKVHNQDTFSTIQIDTGESLTTATLGANPSITVFFGDKQEVVDFAQQLLETALLSK